MAQPGYPPVPPHISGRRGAVPPPSSSNTPHLAFGGPPLPPHKHSAHHHQGPSGASAPEPQPVSLQPALEGTQRGAFSKKVHMSGTVLATYLHTVRCLWAQCIGTGTV